MLAEQENVLRLSPGPAEPKMAAASGRPAFAGGLEAFHRASPRGLVIAIDLAVIASAVALSGGTLVAALAAAIAFLVGAACARLYVRRTTVEAQGLAWYLRVLPLPLLAMAAGLAFVGHGGVRKLVAPLAIAAVVLVLLRAAAWLFVAGDRRRGR